MNKCPKQYKQFFTKKKQKNRKTIAHVKKKQ